MCPALPLFELGFLGLIAAHTRAPPDSALHSSRTAHLTLPLLELGFLRLVAAHPRFTSLDSMTP